MKTRTIRRTLTISLSGALLAIALFATAAPALANPWRVPNDADNRPPMRHLTHDAEFEAWANYR